MPADHSNRSRSNPTRLPSKAATASRKTVSGSDIMAPSGSLAYMPKDNGAA
jgi:hypothetical protein